MKKHHFLTIGQLGKLSNVHVKSLRYYEEIGILNPSQVNPNTGYRYYSYSHIPYVKMIKLCATYEIPLQIFKAFVKDKDTIDLETIVELAHAKILEKLTETQADLKQVEKLQERLYQSQLIDQKQQITHTQDKQLFWLLPFKGDIFDQTYYKLMAEALLELQAVDCQTQHKIGLFYELTPQKTNSYLAIQIPDHHKRPSKGKWLEIAATSFSSRHIQPQDIAETIKSLPTDCCFIWETYEKNYRLKQPHLEISYPTS